MIAPKEQHFQNVDPSVGQEDGSNKNSFFLHIPNYLQFKERNSHHTVNFFFSL